MYDPPSGRRGDNFDAHERDIANTRADEGRMVVRLPEHPLNHRGFKSLDAIERNGPDDPGTRVEYKTVGENTSSAFDDQLRRGLGKFNRQPDNTYNNGDIVMDGRPGGLTEDIARNRLQARLGMLLRNGDVWLGHIGKIEVYLGDGGKLVFEDGRLSRVTDGGTRCSSSVTW